MIAPSVELTEEAAKTETKKVIVVEDDPSLYRFWGKVSKHLPELQITVIKSPKEAVQYLENHSADLLLTDLTMPEMNGIELLKHAQQLHPKMRLLATSGYIGDTTQFTGMDQFLHIIKKPYRNLDHLRELLMIFLKSSHEVANLELAEDGYYIWDL